MTGKGKAKRSGVVKGWANLEVALRREARDIELLANPGPHLKPVGIVSPMKKGLPVWTQRRARLVLAGLRVTPTQGPGRVATESQPGTSGSTPPPRVNAAPDQPGTSRPQTARRSGGRPRRVEVTPQQQHARVPKAKRTGGPPMTEEQRREYYEQLGQVHVIDSDND